MNRKTIITIALTIVFGFVLGFFTSGRLAHKRMGKIKHALKNPQIEREIIAKRLDLSNDQKQVIEPVLDSMIPIQMELRTKHMKEMDFERAKMFNIIKPHLTEKQLQRVERMKKHRPFKRKRRPKGNQ